MLCIYSSKKQVEYLERDFMGELCEKANTEDLTKALNICGYSTILTIGDEDNAEIELYLPNSKTEFEAVILLTLGGTIKAYVTNEFHDALDFMKEYTPTIKGIVDLCDRQEQELNKY